MQDNLKFHYSYTVVLLKNYKRNVSQTICTANKNNYAIIFWRIAFTFVRIIDT